MNKAEDGHLKNLTEDHAVEPRIEYTQRAESRRVEAARQMKSFRKVGILRLASVATGLVLAWFVFKGLIAWWWLLPPTAVFLLLAEVQARIIQARRRCERAAALYEQGLDRLDDRWAGKGATGERFLKSSHLYAEDLDLFGHGSLFELLSIARTRAGEETLAYWLLQPSMPEVVLVRQAAVAELRPRLDLREDLALLGEGVRSGEDAQALVAWAAATPWHISRSMQMTAMVLALLAVVTLILWLAGFGWIPFLVALIIGQAFALRLRYSV